MRRFLVLPICIGLWLPFVGCDDATDPIKNTITCADVCGRYKDCFDANYDADACQTDCENSAEDADYADHAEDCQACIDDLSCTGSFACIDECAGIVP